MTEFFSTPLGLTILGILAAGIGWIVRQTITHFQLTPQRQHSRIIDLQKEMDRLRHRLENMEQDLRAVNVRFFDLTTNYLTLHSKYSAVLSAVKYEGSELTRARVSKVLAVYGDSLDDFDADTPVEKLVHPAFGHRSKEKDLT